MNRFSMSTGCLPRLEGHRFYEFSSVVRMMERFLEDSEVDGFEFVLLPEWDPENPPLTETTAPSECEKHKLDELTKELQDRKLPILSVHANRDIGNYLCSEKTDYVDKGIRLAEQSLDFTEKLGAEICVFHLWDTWKESFNLQYLEALYTRLCEKNPKIEISVENIPSRYANKTPFQLMHNFKHKTLDLKWASLFNEFHSFVETTKQIDNVHIQGKYHHGGLFPTIGHLDYDTALETIQKTGYSGIFTIELEGEASYKEISEYIRKLKAVYTG